MAERKYYYPVIDAGKSQDLFGAKNLVELLGNDIYVNMDGGSAKRECYYHSGKVTVAGSVDSELYIEVSHEFTVPVSGYYYLSGAPLEASLDTYHLSLNTYKPGVYPGTVIARSIGGDTKCYLEKGTYYKVYIRMLKGAKLTEEDEWYPMVRYATATSPAFVPYAPSNKTLSGMLPNIARTNIGRNLTEMYRFGDFYKALEVGDFSDIKPGDYFYAQSGIMGAKFWIADRDTYYHNSQAAPGGLSSKHQVTIIPDVNLAANISPGSGDGYYNSDLRTTMASKATSYEDIFGDHLASFTGYACNAKSTEAPYNPTSYAFYACKADSMTDINIFGTLMAPYEGVYNQYNVGYQTKQFEIFRDLGISSILSGAFWLKNSAYYSSSNEYLVFNGSSCIYGSNSSKYSIRPYMILIA